MNTANKCTIDWILRGQCFTWFMGQYWYYEFANWRHDSNNLFWTVCAQCLWDFKLKIDYKHCVRMVEVISLVLTPQASPIQIKVQFKKKNTQINILQRFQWWLSTDGANTVFFSKKTASILFGNFLNCSPMIRSSSSWNLF